MTAATWSDEAKKRAYRTDGTYSEGQVLPYGVGLLVLAAKVSAIGVLWVRDVATDRRNDELLSM